MTSLEYHERCVRKHYMNLEREFNRGAPAEVLNNIRLKIGYYEEAVEAMKKDRKA